MYLALTDLFKAKWSDQIHEEWMRNVRKDYQDITQVQVERIRDLMNVHVLDCLVTDYEDLIGGLLLPDPNDRHVLAVAIRAEASVIVTSNLQDFPKETLARYGVEAQHPDDFITQLLELAPELVCCAAKQQRTGLKNPPLTSEQYLESLARQGLPKTVGALRNFSALL